MSQHLFLETLNQYWPTQLHLDLCWKRSPMPLHITLFVRDALMMSDEWLTSTQIKTLLIFWWSHLLVPNELSLLGCCSITIHDGIGEDYDGFARIRTSTCLPRYAVSKLTYFLNISQWGLWVLVISRCYPVGFGFILYSFRMRMTLLIRFWCAIQVGWRSCIGLRGVLNGYSVRTDSVLSVKCYGSML